MFSIIFSYIHTSRGAELIVLCNLLHRNPFFLNLLTDLGGVDLLKDMIVEKAVKGEVDRKNLNYLFNITCNEPYSFKIEVPRNEEVKGYGSEEEKVEKKEVIPKFNEKLMDFLDIIILIAKKLKKNRNQVQRFKDMLGYLLKEPNNKKIFENRYGKHLLTSL